MIILEGSDLSGKSTLAKALQDNYGYEIVKCSQPRPGRAYNEYVQKIIKAEPNTVFDRHFLGELVYGPLKRGKCQLNPMQISDIINLLKEKNCTLIYCNAPMDFIKSKFKERGEDFVTIKEIEKVKLAYEKELLWLKKYLNVVVYNIPTKIIPKVCQQNYTNNHSRR